MMLIKDKDNTPQAFPLLRLATLVCRIAGSGDTGIWSVARARGYGTDICALEDGLVVRPTVAIPGRAMLRLMADVTQWFYDLDCQVAPGVRLGVMDSGALFLDAADTVQNDVGAHFSVVERV